MTTGINRSHIPDTLPGNSNHSDKQSHYRRVHSEGDELGFVGSSLPKLKFDNGVRFDNGISEPNPFPRLRTGSIYPVNHQPHKRRTKKSMSLSTGEIITQLSQFRAHREERRSREGTGRRSGEGVREDPRNKTKQTLKVFKQQQKDALLLKFRVVAKMVVFCIKEAKSHNLRNKVYDEVSPFLNNLHFRDFEPTVDLLFDPSKFKADKQLRISDEAKRILLKEPADRSNKEIHYALLALRNIKAFADYPLRMQRKIAEVGSYEKYEAKRVLVRQGHPANAFYFILSGSVVVMVAEGDTNVSKPVAYLNKGMTFGELAIVNRTPRQSTVVAKETLELLSIDVRSFHKIFMSGGTKNITDPDHDQFIRGLPFLQGWPIDMMMDNPKQCIFHFFKSGEVLVKDSRYSEWIYIVKTGSLKVLKKLKRVAAYEWKHEGAKKQEVKTEKQKREEKELRDKQRRYVLPDLKIPLRSPVDDDIDEQFVLPEIDNYTHSEYSDIGSENGNSGHEANEVNGHDWNGKLPNLYRKEQRPITWIQDSDNTENNIKVQNQMKHASLQRIDISDSSKSSVLEHKEQSFITNKSHGDKQKHKRHKQEGKADDWREEMGSRKQEIRDITHDMDTSAKHKVVPEVIILDDEPTDADLNPQFVHVQTLTKGQVFGLSDVMLGTQVSLCLVSNGAECILMNKDFYMKHASEALVRNTRHELCPYPTDDVMQEGLQTAIDWHAYKHTTFDTTLSRLEERHIHKKTQTR